MIIASAQTCPFQEGDKSVFGTNRGELVVSLDECNPGLLLVEKLEDGWHGNTIQ
jgi:hypothetical protein